MTNKKIPKLYSPTKIKFWGLRPVLGSNFGVILDSDIEVVRRCHRVLVENGWKWQIINYDDISFFDPFVASDKMVLDEYGADLDFKVVTND